MRWLPAVILIIVLAFPLLLAGFTMLAVGTFALDRGFYKELLADERLYTIPDAVSGATWVSIPELGALTSRAGLPAVRDVLTPAWLRSQATRVVDQAFDFVEGRGPLDLTLDLVPLKQGLAGEQGRRFAQDYAQSLPICASPTTVRPGTLPTCRPKGQAVSETVRIVQATLPGLTASIPDTVRLGENVPLPWRGFSATRMYFAATALLLLAGLGVWIGAAFTGTNETRGRLLCLGGSLLAPAFVVLLTGLAALAPVASRWVEFGLSSADFRGVGLPADFAAAVVAVARSTLMRVATGFLATGGIAAGVALGLLAWGWSTPPAGRQTTTATGSGSTPTVSAS